MFCLGAVSAFQGMVWTSWRVHVRVCVCVCVCVSQPSGPYLILGKAVSAGGCRAASFLLKTKGKGVTA